MHAALSGLCSDQLFHRKDFHGGWVDEFLRFQRAPGINTMAWGTRKILVSAITAPNACTTDQTGTITQKNIFN